MQGKSPVASTFRYHAGRLVVSQGDRLGCCHQDRSETVEVLLSATKPDVAIIEAEQLTLMREL